MFSSYSVHFLQIVVQAFRSVKVPMIIILFVIFIIFVSQMLIQFIKEFRNGFSATANGQTIKIKITFFERQAKNFTYLLVAIVHHHLGMVNQVVQEYDGVEILHPYAEYSLP